MAELEAIEPAPVVKKTLGWKAGFAAGVLVAGLPLGYKELSDVQLEARKQEVIDSIQVADSVSIVVADSINAANVAPAKYIAVRAKTDDREENKFNPLKYRRGDKQAVLILTYDVDGTDTTLMASSLLKGDDWWLLDQRARIVPSPPPSPPKVEVIE